MLFIASNIGSRNPKLLSMFVSHFIPLRSNDLFTFNLEAKLIRPGHFQVSSKQSETAGNCSFSRSSKPTKMDQIFVKFLLKNKWTENT